MLEVKYTKKTDFLKTLFLEDYVTELKLKINEYRFKHSLLADENKKLKKDLKAIKSNSINYSKQTVNYKKEIIRLQELLFNQINKVK